MQSLPPLHDRMQNLWYIIWQKIAFIYLYLATRLNIFSTLKSTSVNNGLNILEHHTILDKDMISEKVYKYKISKQYSELLTLR